jgi:decaprenyl-phosphate phosphoribosyltransferase
MLIQHYIRLIRPKQWIKSFFVVAPLVFSKELFEVDALVETVKAFLAFSATASAVYIINDMYDVEADRSHPVKRNRPLASGAISLTQAGVVLSLLMVAAAAISIGLNFKFIACLGVYFVMNLAYSLKFKEIVLLDVFIIAAGFMLRVLAGAYAINVQVSSWIVLCTLFVSLFLGFGKRRGEIVLMEESGGVPRRKVLALYKVGFIDQMLTIAAAGTVISYALYTVSPRTIEVFGTDRMIYTTLFVLYGIFRYMYLIHTAHTTESPTDAVTSDSTIIVTVFLWIIACVAFIYSGSAFN